MVAIYRLSAAWLIFTTTNNIGVQAFAPSSSNISLNRRHDRHRHSSSSPSIIKGNNPIKTADPISACQSRSTTRAAAAADGARCSLSTTVLFSGNDNDDDGGNNKSSNNNNDDNNKLENADIMDNFITRRLERADFFQIRRDVILTTCFVLCRYFIYDITTGSKLVPGFEIQDFVYLSGTLSSAALLGLYWTAAGLLTRLFESNSLLANAVTVAAICPLWVASEHLLGFGPSDVGGPTLDASVANGFVGLASFMTITKTLTRDWK